jgi:hypothetical protein
MRRRIRIPLLAIIEMPEARSRHRRRAMMNRLGAMLAAIVATAMPAIGDEALTHPDYFGERSNNPEQETFAIPANEDGVRVTAFFGPTRTFGVVTGDVEKDTVAYRTIVVAPVQVAEPGSDR